MTKKEIKSFVKSLIAESIVNNKIDVEKVAHIVQAIRKAPYPYSLMILEEYAKIITIEKNKRTFTITSAHKIDPEEIVDITKNFNKGKDFVEQSINPSLIAGLQVANSDFVLDLTIKREIDNLEKAIA